MSRSIQRLVASSAPCLRPQHLTPSLPLHSHPPFSSVSDLLPLPLSQKDYICDLLRSSTLLLISRSLPESRLWTLFPYKGTFTGSRDWDLVFWGGHYSAYDATSHRLPVRFLRETPACGDGPQWGRTDRGEFLSVPGHTGSQENTMGRGWALEPPEAIFPAQAALRPDPVGTQATGPVLLQ